MSKLISMLVAAVFALGSVSAFAASHTGAMDKKDDKKMDKMDKKSDKAAKKSDGKKKSGKSDKMDKDKDKK